jgi:hypothetical protein
MKRCIEFFFHFQARTKIFIHSVAEKMVNTRGKVIPRGDFSSSGNATYAKVAQFVQGEGCKRGGEKVSLAGLFILLNAHTKAADN